ncbi:MAG: hypothetical protein AAGI37_20125 [Planctomycetota bacterium]
MVASGIASADILRVTATGVIANDRPELDGTPYDNTNSVSLTFDYRLDGGEFVSINSNRARYDNMAVGTIVVNNTETLFINESVVTLSTGPARDAVQTAFLANAVAGFTTMPGIDRIQPDAIFTVPTNALGDLSPENVVALDQITFGELLFNFPGSTLVPVLVQLDLGSFETKIIPEPSTLAVLLISMAVIHRRKWHR